MLVTSEAWKHVELLFSGATALALVGHAVNSFPTPQNIYGQWLLGVIKFAVGQRISAVNAINGQDTAAITVPRGTAKDFTAAVQGSSSSTTTAATTEAADGKIKVVAEHTTKTETVIPNPNSAAAPNSADSTASKEKP